MGIARWIKRLLGPSYSYNYPGALLYRAQWCVDQRRNGGHWSDFKEVSRIVRPTPGGPAYEQYLLKTRWIALT